MGYLGARGTLIYEKNLMSKISCQTPFKGTVGGDACLYQSILTGEKNLCTQILKTDRIMRLRREDQWSKFGEHTKGTLAIRWMNNIS